MSKKFKALLLAGGKSKPALRKETGKEYKALMAIDTLGFHPIIHHIIDILENTMYISKIYVACPNEVYQEIESREITALPSGNTLMETLKKSIPMLRHEDYILIITCDIPLLSNTHLERFIQDCLANPGFDIYYSIVDKEDFIKKFPQNELRRIYANLIEGSFTGGNLFLINPRVIIDCADIIEEFINFRKHPLKMANILGARIGVKYLKKYLSIRDLEKLVPQYLKGYSGKAILSAPEVALDIDKQVQLNVFRKL